MSKHPEPQISTNSESAPLSIQPSTSSSSDWWASPRQPLSTEFFQAGARRFTSVGSERPPQPDFPVSSPFSFFSLSPGPSDRQDEDSANPFTDEGPASPAMLFLSGFTPSSRSNSFCPSDFATPSESSKLREEESNEPQEEIVGGYVLGETIGHGGFSIIKRAILSDPEHSRAASVAAVKIVNKNNSSSTSKDNLRRFQREASIWSKLSHEHILPLFQTIETSKATYLFTLYCPAGSLLDIVNSHKDTGGVNMDDAGMMFRQIVRGLKYLHEQMRLVHGDIKLENVLVDDMGSCRIADFGLATWMEDPTPNNSERSSATVTPAEFEDESESSTTSLDRLGGRLPPQRQLLHLSLQRAHRRAAGSAASKKFRGSTTPLAPLQLPNHPQDQHFPPGSLPYASPELLAPHSSPIKPNSAQDIWALGCVLYALLFGKLPFWDVFEPRLQMKIVKGVWRLPSPTGRTNGISRSRKSLGTSKSRRSRSRSVARSPVNTTFKNVSPSMTRDSSYNRSRSKSRGRSSVSNSNTPTSPSGRTSIGKVAEKVLKGCLCMNVKERWSVRMIDEVGWAVGWDLDVDSAEVVDEEGHCDLVMKSPTIEEDAVNESETHATGELGISSVAGQAVADVDWASSGSPLEARDSRPSGEVRFSRQDGDTSQQESSKSSRSRGKRGKTSRSSSRAANSRENASASSSGASSPSVPHALDPFTAFRQGHIPASFLALSSYTQTTSNLSPVDSRSPVISRDHSRASSREPSRVRESPSYAQFRQGWAPPTITATYSPPESRSQSRAASKERAAGAEKEKFARGRSMGTNPWRMTSVSETTGLSLSNATQHPPPSSTLSSFPSIGSLTTAPSTSTFSNGPHTNTSSTSPPPPWTRRQVDQHPKDRTGSRGSESPNSSPAPATPVDGIEERRSRSLGRERRGKRYHQIATRDGDTEGLLDSW